MKWLTLICITMLVRIYSNTPVPGYLIAVVWGVVIGYDYAKWKFEDPGE